MPLSVKNLISILGILLVFLAALMMIPLALSFVYDEQRVSVSFISSAVFFAAIGFLLARNFPIAKLKLKNRDGFLIVTGCWLIFSLISAIPFVATGAIPNAADAFFESCSGYSTTGSTILTDIESLPKSILFWRSMTHWIGGLGIVVFTSAIFALSGIEGQAIVSVETPGPTFDKISPRFSENAKKLVKLYIFFTFMEVLFLMLGGVSVYDSFLHTFGTVGTGGFSCYNESIAHFQNPYVHWVIIAFMLLCGINFNLFFMLIKYGIKNFFSNDELILYLKIIAISSILTTTNLMLKGGYEVFGKAVRESVFQVVSIITTTGYITSDYELWPTFTKMILLTLMLTGACASSTGGGPKVIRIIMGLKLIRRGITLRIHPKQVYSISISGQNISQEIMTNAANFLFLYILTIFAGTTLISIDGFDVMTTFSAVVTCIGNVGPGFSGVGPTFNFANFSSFSKIILSIIMIAGRLELFAVFSLFSRKYWNPNRA